MYVYLILTSLTCYKSDFFHSIAPLLPADVSPIWSPHLLCLMNIFMATEDIRGENFSIQLHPSVQTLWPSVVHEAW